VGERLSPFRGTVVLQDSIGDHADLSACSQKLHDFCALAGHFCPTRFGLRILFQSAKLNAVQFKIYLCQAIFFHYTKQDCTIWLPMVAVINAGAPSAILGWKVHYKSPTLDEDVEVVNFSAQNLEVPIPGSSETFKMQPAEAYKLETRDHCNWRF
jgi:hypothetical protein